MFVEGRCDDTYLWLIIIVCILCLTHNKVIHTLCNAKSNMMSLFNFVIKNDKILIISIHCHILCYNI